jgi:hypothetical protein
LKKSCSSRWFFAGETSGGDDVRPRCKIGLRLGA